MNNNHYHLTYHTTCPTCDDRAERDALVLRLGVTFVLVATIAVLAVRLWA
jgi:hypothetical protein